MAAKKLVQRATTARARLQGCQPREWTQRQIAGDLLQRAFGGSARSCLWKRSRRAKRRVANWPRIRQLLDEYERETR